MPGGLPDRYSCDGLTDLRIADKRRSNSETLGTHDKKLQL